LAAVNLHREPPTVELDAPPIDPFFVGVDNRPLNGSQLGVGLESGSEGAEPVRRWHRIIVENRYSLDIVWKLGKTCIHGGGETQPSRVSQHLEGACSRGAGGTSRKNQQATAGGGFELSNTLQTFL
jgi:hypothetical protein